MPMYGRKKIAMSHAMAVDGRRLRGMTSRATTRTMKSTTTASPARTRVVIEGSIRWSLSADRRPAGGRGTRRTSRAGAAADQRKLTNCRSRSTSAPLSSAMVCCRSSRLLLETRSSSPSTRLLMPLGPSSRMILPILLRVGLVDALLERDLDAVLLAGREGLALLEALEADAALDHLRLQHVEDRLHALLARGLHEDGVAAPLDGGAHVLEVVALLHLLLGLVDGVVRLHAVDLADDVERGICHADHVKGRARAGPRRGDPTISVRGPAPAIIDERLRSVITQVGCAWRVTLAAKGI